jgi:alpha-tubulin suppressor-like RCC1 family protein
MRRVLPISLLVLLAVAGCNQNDATAPDRRARPALATSGPPAQLSFATEPPTSVEGAAAISPPVQVVIEDSLGTTDSAAVDTVTLAFATNPSGATLLGTTRVTAVGGVATFSDLRVDRPGTGYTLAATAPGLAGATSSAFAVRLTFVAVSAGLQHTCGVTVSGAAYCWGYNGFGQLGDGTTTSETAPVLVAGGLTFTTVSVGGGLPFLFPSRHTCGVTTSGAAYCWGNNSQGQLGDGTTTSRVAPVPVSGGLSFTRVAGGTGHTCGVTTTDVAYCWGWNYEGQLGDGTTASRATPAPVIGGLSFTEIDGGAAHSCGVTTTGAGSCWGLNDDGELGDGTVLSRASPDSVLGVSNFAAIDAGVYHTCGVTTSGTAYCWGWNGFGQLGNGTSGNALEQHSVGSRQPVATPVSGGLTFSGVSAGYTHSCGVTSGGVAYCWGNNAWGQFGNGTTTSDSVPVPVAAGLTFTAVSAGYYYTCGVTPSGAAYCWGYNANGQLGNGTNTNSLSPMPVGQ